MQKSITLRLPTDHRFIARTGLNGWPESGQPQRIRLRYESFAFIQRPPPGDRAANLPDEREPSTSCFGRLFPASAKILDRAGLRRAPGSRCRTFWTSFWLAPCEIIGRLSATSRPREGSPAIEDLPPALTASGSAQDGHRPSDRVGAIGNLRPRSACANTSDPGSTRSI